MDKNYYCYRLQFNPFVKFNVLNHEHACNNFDLTLSYFRRPEHYYHNRTILQKYVMEDFYYEKELEYIIPGGEDEKNSGYFDIADVLHGSSPG